MQTNRYQIDSIIVDTGARDLRLDGETLTLEPRAFDLLVYLIEHRDRAVPKEELINEVWRGRVVTDGVLYRSIKLVRDVLSEVGKPSELVRTVHRVGYQLMADVQVLGSSGAAAEAQFLIALHGDDIKAPAPFDGELETGTENFRLVGNTEPSDTIKFLVDQQSASRNIGFGVHFGQPDDATAVQMAAAIATGARAKQILMTATAFEQFRVYGAGSIADSIDWLAHGPYRLAELSIVTSLFEAGVRPHAPMCEPTESSTLHRSGAEDVILGWRAAPDQPVPGREHWRLMECLGEGGFGEAWLALHEMTKERRVFKFCYRADRLRSLQREVTLFRLLNETLGIRPDIARILDWNFDTAPYFVESEFSESGDLLQWSEEQGGLESVPLSDRLSIVAGIADALAAAHSVGVLHKDIKPANILVREFEDTGTQPVLADFGVGLIANRDALENLDITRLGLSGTATEIARSSRSGTRRYMAPEVLEGKPPSIQADIYSLGVVLFQIVVGDFSRVIAPGWERDVEDAILRSDIAEMIDGDPRRRLTDASAVAPRLRSLDQRRERQLVEVEARRQAEKDRSRRRILTAVAGVALAMLAVMVVQNKRVDNQRQLAEASAAEAKREAAKAQSVAKFLNGLFDAANPLYASETPTLAGFIKEGATRIEFELEDQPGVRAELERTLGNAFNTLGDRAEALKLLLASIEDAQSADDVSSEIASRNSYASYLAEDEAFEAMDQQLALAETLTAQLPPKQAAEQRSRMLAIKARAKYVQSNPSEGVELLQEAVALRASVAEDDDVTLGTLRSQLAGYMAATGKAEMSEITSLYQQSIEALESKGDKSIAYLTTLGDFARHLNVIGQSNRSREYAGRALAVALERLGAEHRYTAGFQFQLGRIVTDPKEAERLLLASRDTRRKLVGDHLTTSVSEWGLARFYIESERWEEALESAQSAHEMRMRVSSGNAGARAETALALGTALFRVGRNEESLEVLGEALELAQSVVGDDHWLTGSIRDERVRPLLALGQQKAAIDESAEAVRVMKLRYDLRSPMLRGVYATRVEALVMIGEQASAMSLIDQLADETPPAPDRDIDYLRSLVRVD